MSEVTSPGLDLLGYTPEEQAEIVVDAARHAAYQLAAQERSVPMADLAARHNVVELVGPERWRRLGASAFAALQGLTVRVTIDERGPVISVDEMSRLGAIVLARYLANEGKE